MACEFVQTCWRAWWWLRWRRGAGRRWWRRWRLRRWRWWAQADGHVGEEHGATSCARHQNDGDVIVGTARHRCWDRSCRTDAIDNEWTRIWWGHDDAIITTVTAPQGSRSGIAKECTKEDLEGSEIRLVLSEVRVVHHNEADVCRCWHRDREPRRCLARRCAACRRIAVNAIG